MNLIYLNVKWRCVIVVGGFYSKDRKISCWSKLQYYCFGWNIIVVGKYVFSNHIMYNNVFYFLIHDWCCCCVVNFSCQFQATWQLLIIYYYISRLMDLMDVKLWFNLIRTTHIYFQIFQFHNLLLLCTFIRWPIIILSLLIILYYII